MQDVSTISLIIPTYFRPKILKNLLESIHTQNIDRQKVQVIVVSNFEDKKTTQVINQYKDQLFDLKYFVSGHKGCNIARNYGIRFASCDVFYFLDDDCVLDDPNQLNKIIEFHNKYPEATGIGGGYKDRKDKQNAAEIIYSKNQNLWLKKSTNENNETHHLIGGNASFKAHIFKKGYNFNSSITFGGAEVSLTKRLFDDGYQLLYFPELSVLHDLRVNSLQILKKGFMQGKGKFTNCSPEEARKFAGYIKNIIPRAENTIELNSKYQRCIWYLFHFMFKMGFHWNFYCSQNNKSNKSVLGFLGGISYLRNHFNYVSKNKSEQVHKKTRLVFIRSWYLLVKTKYLLLRAWFPTRRITRLIGIKTYWYGHALYNFFFRKIIFKRIFKPFILFWKIYRLRARTVLIKFFYNLIYKKIILGIFIKPTKIFWKTYRLRARTFTTNIYLSLRRFFRPIYIKIFWLPNEIKKLIYKFGRKIIKPIFIKFLWLPNEIRKFSYKIGRKFYVYGLIKLFWLPNEVRKLIFKVNRKLFKPLFIKLFWLPNEIRKLGYKWGRKFYVYGLVKLYWLPNEIRKFLYLIGRKVFKPILIKLFWMPNEIRKLGYKWGRKFYVYGLVKIYWLPNEIRKLLYLIGRKVFKPILIKLFWMPNEIRKLSYKWGRRFYVYGLVKIYWLPNEIRKLLYLIGRKIFKPILIKLFWMPNEIRKFSYKWGRRFYVYGLVRLFWLPNEIRKLSYKWGRRFYVYGLVKLFWLPNEMRKFSFKWGRRFYVYGLIKLFWFPNEIRKFSYKWGRRFYVYGLVKLFWLPNEIRKFSYKWGRKFYIYVLIKIYWLPNEIRKLFYRIMRKIYYSSLNLFYKALHWFNITRNFYFRVKNIIYSQLKYRSNLMFIKVKNVIFNTYYFTKKIVLKPFYIIRYQISKRSKKKATLQN